MMLLWDLQNLCIHRFGFVVRFVSLGIIFLLDSDPRELDVGKTLFVAAVNTLVESPMMIIRVNFTILCHYLKP